MARLVQDRRFERAIIALIAINAVILGLETSPAVMAVAGDALRFALDDVDQADVGEVVLDDPLGRRHADEAGAYHCYFSHGLLPRS